MKRGSKLNKSGQVMGLPFGMIFSIILIVVFIVVAIIVILMFINPNECAIADQAQEGMFKQDLQEAVNNLWSSDGGSFQFNSSLPSKITKVCFLNLEEGARGKYSSIYNELKKYGSGNTFLYPSKQACPGFKSMKIEHINLDKITETNNPSCVESKGKVSFWLEKDINEALVKIS